MFDPEGPLWIQVVDPENGGEAAENEQGDGENNTEGKSSKQKDKNKISKIKKWFKIENAESNGDTDTAKARNDDNAGDNSLEPPSPSKTVYENTACLQKKRTTE